MNYFPTIGLEIHAEVKTRTKMFCDSRNDPDETRPNANVCPICLGHPGTLPVINKEAVKHILKIGIALGGTLADFSEFDRKNYFYPDIPKGYQISQYKRPLVSGGSLNGIAITRVHLEEDTGTLIHEDGGNADASGQETQINADTNSSSALISGLHQRSPASLVDYNRAGVPLLELVTEPVIHDAKTAVDFGKELQLILRYLNASGANMEKGEFRMEANVSVAPANNQQPTTNNLGTKVEVKNLNSFRAMERAIDYEIARQTALLESGERVIQETRGWDGQKWKTFSQRRKEESHDYRYFPEPDLPKLYVNKISEFASAVLKREMPELPAEKRKRLSAAYGVKAEDAEILVVYRELGEFFEDVAKVLVGADAKKAVITLASSYLTSDLMGLLKKIGAPLERLQLPFNSREFAELARMISEKKLSSRGAKDILAVMFEKGGSPDALAQKLGLLQKSDEGELRNIVQEIISANPQAVADYRGGKQTALQFLVGQGMKAARGSANPELLRSILEQML